MANRPNVKSLHESGPRQAHLNLTHCLVLESRKDKRAPSSGSQRVRDRSTRSSTCESRSDQLGTGDVARGRGSGGGVSNTTRSRGSGGFWLGAQRNRCLRVLGRGALAFFFSVLVIIIKIARARALALIAMRSPSFSILAGGILKIAKLHRRDRAAFIFQIWSVLQQIHNIDELGGNLADLCPNSPNKSVRVVPHSSEEVQIDSWIPALHNGKRGLHATSEGRVKHDGKLAGSSLQVPSNVFIGLQDNWPGARSEKHGIQLLDTGFVSTQG